MPPSNLIKLAPTLSAEERFKVIVSDLHKEVAGGKPVLSESERQAIIQCKGRASWEEYTRHIGTMQWASAFWMRDVETEKLRVFASYLMLSRAVDRLVTAAFMKLPSGMLSQRLSDIKEGVGFFESNSITFYAIWEAIAQIEQKEICGMPLFDEKRKAVIAGYYAAMDELFDEYNGRIRALSEAGVTKKIMKPVREDLGSYTAKKSIPLQAMIDELIAEVMQVVDSEMDMLGK
jgi:hypothetical protein